MLDEHLECGEKGTGRVGVCLRGRGRQDADARAVCAGVGACVLVESAGTGWAAGLQKREKKKKMCRRLKALRLQVGRSRMARMCWRPPWVPVPSMEFC